MKRICLSEKEKEMLRRLSEKEFDYDSFADFTQSEINVASEHLQRYGLIIAHSSNERGLEYAGIDDKGIVYLKENPNLDNPVDNEELKRLQKINLELSNNELEYKKKIRFWKTVSAILAVISTTLGIINFIAV
jgi:hypothetical protein